MAKMSVGPVIGKVTATTARVLLESDGDADVTCIITAPDSSQVSQTKHLQKGRPTVFSFKDLKPGTPHSVTFMGLKEPRVGRVVTFPSQLDRLNLAAVSCNNTPRRGETELWQDLFDRYVAPGAVGLLLHLGDQVYGDRAFEGAVRILDGKPRATPRQEREILELYRQLYRWAWNHPPTLAVLANVPNLMVWDDHEIRDDWGSRPADGDPQSVDYLVGSLARRVYREYQRQLWDDCNVDADAPAGELEHHSHALGEVGILFVDQRGGRSFSRDPVRPFLGSGQWREITKDLESGPLSTVRALIVVTSVPLVYLGTSTSSVGSAVVDDLRDHWAYGPHRQEQIEFLRLLRKWKEAKPDREVQVLGGDVHVGGETEVRHNGKPIFRQLITSAITNAGPPLMAYAAIRLLLEQEESLGHGYSFEHSNFTHKRNFGVVVVRVPPAGARPHLVGSLNRA